MADSGKSNNKFERKQEYFAKLSNLLDEYPKILIVQCSNVGSFHMQKIRKILRGEAIILMGKNTMIRKAIRSHVEKNADLEHLLPCIKGEVGLVFTKGDLSQVRKKLLSERVAAPAKAGSIAPVDVSIKAGTTGLEPTKTSFFQALNIPTKINRGQIEIINELVLIRKGDKVGSSESTLLQMLNIKPFSYGLQTKTVYDNGQMYDDAILEITDEQILGHFAAGLRQVASISLAIGIPNIASLPHTIASGFKNVLAIAMATDITFKLADRFKNASANPVHVAPTGNTNAAVVEEEKPKEEEEEAVEVGGLFGDDF
jgi:large subunit ribosomal protein LP0